MGPILAIKSGTTSVQGATVKGDFRYFSASTLDLGPTSITGLYSGIDAPDGGYTVYQIGGPNGLNARVATDTTGLNTILITAGATGSTLNERIIWATNTNTIFINSGTTSPFYFFVGTFTRTDVIAAYQAISLNSDGSTNVSFDTKSGFDTTVVTSAIQSDGKILAGGTFTTYQSVSQLYLIRLNSDGSKDTSFNPTNYTDIKSISIQSDGKILIGGGFAGFFGSEPTCVARLNSNGSLDTSFTTGFDPFQEFIVFSTTIQSDGKILAGGDFTVFSGSSQNRLIRLNSNGSKDTSFNIGTGFDNIIYSTAIQSDGKILVGGTFTTFTGTSQNRLIRLNSDGSKDSTFNIGTGFNGAVLSISIQSDGKILVGGQFTTYQGSSQNYSIRLNSDGSKDTSFNIGTGFGSTVNSIAIQSDGKILVGGFFSSFSGVTQNNLIRLNSNGSKDPSFDIGLGFVTRTTFASFVNTITIGPDGKLFIGGFFRSYQGVSQPYIIKTLGLSKDNSFDVGTGFNNSTTSIRVQSDGKILVGGQFTTYQGATQNRLIRLNSDGSKDTSFNIGTGFNSQVNSIAIQSDGKILVGGFFTTFTGTSQNYLIRLNSDGSKDTSFNIGTGFGSTVNSIAIQSDGKILVGGTFTTYQGSSQNHLIRLNSDGSKDTSFNIGTGFEGNINSIAIQSDGKMLVGGNFDTYQNIFITGFLRLNSDGSLDTSFNTGEGLSTVNSIAIQSDGKILVGGSFTTYEFSSQRFIIRFNSNGSKDTSFNIGTGFNDSVNSIAIQSDGKILVVGNFSSYNGILSVNNILLNSDGSINKNTLKLSSTVNSVAIQQ